MYYSDYKTAMYSTNLVCCFYCRRNSFEIFTDTLCCVCRRNMSIVSDSGDEKEFRASAAEEALIGNGKVKKSLFKRKSKRVDI